MSKMEYMPVDCLQVPKVLFQMEKYKNLSNTAKILYSLFLVIQSKGLLITPRLRSVIQVNGFLPQKLTHFL